MIEELKAQMKILEGIHSGCAYLGFNSMTFIESLMRWVDAGKLLTEAQQLAANNVSRAVAKRFDRINNSDEYEDRAMYGMDCEM